ncbi:MAG: hypothetical protein A2600_00495 [Candidatus Lambdaproteobacteria bacterium RIFOXYD1_FULL_56_27]|uniref:Uncharacterized protein n=1 Tax=Candidatus Lambdaproteobacteria bacterium RIFOXYD2_FULL_56_26 TaxID=1817773 RepID=A0A1F6GLX1_9PROT|nr:MAG: hypothetical protein A2557_10030 [Candidatus Lambdaproteobacteria bacterium RIFOXYD2_FULL_56_26]OGH01472.1 MAG: hypothetical protein A2426_08815 [Candidatus Lambdaproteobacteria bacterium RIFOXYC1_FULL_56_13]OGH07041.1 MAG: hypothetical protein A2600_00495 [Candidatus Lambdaproteobacteria bacterium RIFOXYD1_FULL_56_27]
MKDKPWPLGFKSVSPRRLIQRLALFLVLASFLGTPIFASSMQDSIEEAASLLASSELTQHKDRFIIIEVVNLHSKKRDQTAKAIETQLYQALGKEFKDFKLLFLDDSLAGVNLGQAIFVQGTYEPKGKTVTATFQAVIGVRGEAVGQAQVTFDAPKVFQAALVAVLDLEAPELTANQRRAYSDLFRSRLQESKKMRLASSAEVAKMSPDAIQQSYKCSRDECATIIGEQMGVDRVISTSLLVMGQDWYMLSSKVMDIKNGSILTSKTLEHRGGLEEMGVSLNTLADRLVGSEAGAEVEKAFVTPVPQKSVAPLPEEPEPLPEPTLVSAAESGLGAWVWHGAALGTMGISLASSNGAAKSYDSLATENQTLESQYKVATSLTEATSLEEKFAANQAKMKKLQSQVTQFNALALGAGLWEAYLLFLGGEVEVASVRQPGLYFALEPGQGSGDSARLSFSYNW